MRREPSRASLPARLRAWFRALVRTPGRQKVATEYTELGNLTRRRLIIVGDLLDAPTHALVRQLGIAEAELGRARDALSGAEGEHDMRRTLDALRAEIDRYLSPAEGRLGAVLALLPPRSGRVVQQVTECIASAQKLSASARDACSAAARIGEVQEQWRALEDRYAPLMMSVWRRAAADGALLKRAAHVTSLAAAERLARDVALLADSCERRRERALATVGALSGALDALGGDPRDVVTRTPDLGACAAALNVEVLRLARKVNDTHGPAVLRAADRHVAYARGALEWAIEPSVTRHELASASGHTMSRWLALRAFRIVVPDAGDAMVAEHEPASEPMFKETDDVPDMLVDPYADEPPTQLRGIPDRFSIAAAVEPPTAELVAAALSADCPIRVELSRRYGNAPQVVITVRFDEDMPRSEQFVTPPGITIDLANAIDRLLFAEATISGKQAAWAVNAAQEQVREILVECRHDGARGTLKLTGAAGSTLTLVGQQREHFAAALRRLA